MHLPSLPDVRPVALCLAAALLAPAVHAQVQAPGLWEHTVTMKSPGGEMERAQAQLQQQLAAMPPEQRKKIEDMMASRGVKMNAQGTTVQVCVTPQQAARPPEPHLSGDCKQSEMQRSGSSVRYKFSCSTPRPVSGEGQLTYTGDKAYSGHSQVTTAIDGKPQQMSMSMAGRWIAADCAGVKPVGQ